MGHASRLCADRLNAISAWWFWGTICGVFYCGFSYVLPIIYEGYSDIFMTCHHVGCYVMFLQMMVNWTCVKFVKSPFKPQEHMVGLTEKDTEEIMAGGFEINLNHLKPQGQQECSTSYALPVSSIYQNGTNQPAKPPKTANGTMYLVAVPRPEVEADSPNVEDNTKRLVYPYWSWKPCLICQCHRPPRTHHCPLCKTCVLKRDHHCFFTNSCVGLRNQRHFVSFTFWAAVATVYCLVHSAIYMFTVYIPRNSYWDLFLPFTLIRWVLGYTSSLDTLMMVLLYSLVWFSLTAIGFFVEQLKCMLKGVTGFEEDNQIKITNTNSKMDNIRGVFGEYWYLNFLFPLHFIFPNGDDGVHWRNIKV